MVTITSYPSQLSLAGNPVLVKAFTSFNGLTFLKICLRLTASLYVNDVRIKESVLDFSIPTSGTTDPVVFDLSSSVQSLFSQVEHSSFDVSRASGGYVQASFKLWDEYLADDNYIVSSESTQPASGSLRLIPGSYTDIQRLLLPEDTAQTFSTERIMSNKPDGEIIPTDMALVVPVFSPSARSASLLVGDASVGSVSLREKETAWGKASFASVSPGRCSLSVQTDRAVSTFSLYLVSPHPHATYFEFVNRLGALESIVCYSRKTYSDSITFDRNKLYSPMSFRPAARYAKHVSSEEQSIDMSTGPLSREWSRWFAEEFFRAEDVWMKHPSLDVMVPVVIEPEEDIQLYDESEAQTVDLDFTVVVSWSGMQSSRFL